MGIENVRVVVHMALAFWGCWGNMSLEMSTYEYNYHIHSRALVDNLTHYHVGSLGTMILSDKVSMLFTKPHPKSLQINEFSPQQRERFLLAWLTVSTYCIKYLLAVQTILRVAATDQPVRDEYLLDACT